MNDHKKKDDEKKREFSCKATHGEMELEWGNSKGIAPPSESAKPLMHTEGYADDAGPVSPVRDDAADPEKTQKPRSMSHQDEFGRRVPKQRDEPK